jgi:hypothetical protein
MLITAQTIDNYKGFQYVVPKRLTSRQSPYVKVRWQNKGVAYILLEDSRVVFYETAPSEAKEQITVLETWIKKNIVISKRAWNKLNEVKV